MEVGEKDLEYVKLNPICLDCGKRITASNANSHHENCEQRYRLRATLPSGRAEQQLVNFDGDQSRTISSSTVSLCKRSGFRTRQSAFAAAASLMDSYEDR